MSVTKWEFEQHIVHRIRGVFEAMDKEEQTAGDAFEDARLAVTVQILKELRMVNNLSFDRFNDNYMRDVSRDTRF